IHHGTAGHTRGAIVARSARLNSAGRWRASAEWRAYGRRRQRPWLCHRKETHRMRLVLGSKSPLDAIAGVNPQLIRQKGVGLLGLIRAFGPDNCIPGYRALGLGRFWNHQECERQHSAESNCKTAYWKTLHGSSSKHVPLGENQIPQEGRL